MERRGTLLLVALGMLLVLGLGLWLILDGSADSADDNSSATSLSAGDTAATPAMALPAVGARPVESHAGLPDLAAAVPDATARSGPPESYKRALGGLKGRVLQAVEGSADGGSPVVGMTVAVAGARESSFLLPQDALLNPERLEMNLIAGEAVTDHEGRFLIESLDPRTLGALMLDPGGPRASFRMLEITPASGIVLDLGDIILPRCATLVGLVVDERSKPIRNARVRVLELPPLPIPSDIVATVADYRAGSAIVVPEGTDGLDETVIFQPPASLARHERLLPVPTTFTDAEGRFVLPGVPPGLVALAIDHISFLPFAQLSVPTGAAGGERDLGQLMLGDGLTLSITTEDDRGQQVMCAEVLAGNRLSIAPVGLLRGTALQQAADRHEVRGLKPGDGWVAARRSTQDDFVVVEVPDMSAGKAVVRFPTPRQATFTVLDESGAPIQSARIFGRPLSAEGDDAPDFIVPPQSLEKRSSQPKPGQYVLTGLRPGGWQLVAIAPGYGQRRAWVDLATEDGSVEVRLPIGLGVSARVVRAADNTPVEHCRVDAFVQGEDWNPIGRAPLTSAMTDAEGRVRLPDLPAGTIRLQATYPGLAVGSHRVELAADGKLTASTTTVGATSTVSAVQEVMLPLVGGGSLFGVVLEQGRAPEEPLLVILNQGDSSGDGEMPRFTLTDLDGEFRFEDLEPGEAEIEVRPRLNLSGGAGMMMFASFFESPLAEGEVEIEEDRESSITLTLGDQLAGKEVAQVSGQLFVNGRATEGWTVAVWGDVRRMETTDSSGRFDLGKIVAGDAHLWINAAGSNFGSPVHSVQLKLEPDEHRVLDLHLEVGSLSGRVLSALDGQPLVGISVNAQEEGAEQGWFGGPDTSTDAEGRFRIEPVKAGSYRLSASGQGWAQARTEVFSLSGLQERSGLELRLTRALKLAGTVSFEGLVEEPRWVWMTAQSKNGGSETNAEVDRIQGTQDWRFSFDELDAGVWIIEAHVANSPHAFASQELSVSADNSNLRLHFVPAPPPPPPPPEAEEALKSAGYIK
ncbi:MAG: carboxypeptidase regulatory-like domain-containing protein [Planctomycetota bacterium]